MSTKYKYKYKSASFKGRPQAQLTAGLSGFLCTCTTKFQERDCVRESYNLLNEFGDKLFGPESFDDVLPNAVHSEKKNPDVVPDESDEDFDKAYDKEMQTFRLLNAEKPLKKRFQVIESGANGIVFIKTLVPDPVKLAHTILSSASVMPKSKYLLRLLPVEMTCKAYIDDICNVCDSLFEKYFRNEEKTFAVVYNHRNNDRIKRDELIEKVAALVYSKNSKNKTDLKQPQLAVLIEVIRSICCISIVPDFYQLRKYNLVEVAAQRTRSRTPEKEDSNSSY